MIPRVPTGGTAAFALALVVLAGPRGAAQGAPRQDAAAARPVPVSQTAPARSAAATAVARGVRAEAFRAHLDFLADDALEGRGTGARGGAVAARYIAAQFARLGLEPAGDQGTYFQAIPLEGRRFSSGATMLGPDTVALRPGDDIVLYVAGGDSAAAARGRPVFVGYGLVAPEIGWDDYAAADVRGRVVIALAGTPAERDSSLARRLERADYAFRQYKVEEALRHGAAGALVIWRERAVPASWAQVARAWLDEQMALVGPDSAGAPHGVAGWLNQPAAERLAAGAGAGLAQWVSEAGTPGFRARELPVTLELSATALRRRVRAANVVARLPGSGPLAREAVVLGAHYDHLGIGPAVAGDSIYNGALDNAAGTAAMLAIAEAAARVPGRAGRAIYFVAFTAEEKGLLGSEAFVRRPPVPLPRITAMLNIDGIGAFAMPRDVAALGAEYSWLGATFAAAAAAEGFRVTPPGSTPLEVARQQDFFGRSDQLPFARAGVPALDLYFVADEYVGRPRGWGVQQLDLYLRERYHQPNDDLSQPFDARYVIPQLRAYARTLVGTATSVDGPQWYPGAPYRRPDS